MRIAISGAHQTGKSTLIERLSDALPGHSVVDEPYHLLEQEGYEFSGMPSLEDFEMQLERSIACLEAGGRDVLFDRCPVDLLGYLMSHEDAASFDPEAWLARIRPAIETLDLIVFVPVEAPDRVALTEPDTADLRLEVDALLREMILENSLGFDVEVLPVKGSLEARARQVLAQLRRRRSG